jgi:predicted RNA-binding protein YlxR (DUF448 family)/ribosomal protein L30E
MKSPASSRIEVEPQRRERERRCIVTREAGSAAGLLRFVRGPQGQAVPDVAAKLPGRGAWVSANRRAVTEAASRNLFSRAFKAETQAGADLADQTENLLARRCLDLLGLARRAGALAVGATQVESAVRAGRALLLVEAADGAADAREKLMALYIGLTGVAPRVVGCFGSAELGVALGRERVIHACLLQERLASDLAVEIARLAGFRAIVPGSWPDSPRFVGWDRAAPIRGPRPAQRDAMAQDDGEL